jgi:hypothetical protein
VVFGGLLTLRKHEIVDCSAFCEVTFFRISRKNLLGDFFYRLNATHNLRGQLPIPRLDAAIPRQVDAVVRSIFQFAKDVTSELVLNFGMAGDGLAKTCSWVLVPIMSSTGADKNATQFLNLPNKFFSLHAT